MPIRRTAYHLGFAVALVFLCTPWAPVQQAFIQGNPETMPRDRRPPPRTGTARVKGQVVDGITGAAVARARVTVQVGMRSSVMTDAAGGFAFSNLPAGFLMLYVEKPTYMRSQYPPAGRTLRSARPVTLVAGQVLEDITIPLFRGAAIMGRVLDAHGDPLDNAQVSVLRVPAASRSGRAMMRAGSSTDDRGEFRVGRLDAGTYVVQVNARRNPSPGEMMPGAVPEPPAPQPLPTYYPGALSIEQAQPITLERGQTATDIDVILAEGFPGVINGTVTTANGSSIAGSNAFINVRRITSDTGGGFDGFSHGTGLRPDGTFKLTLPPGEYQLEVRITPRTVSGPPRPEDELFATMKATVTSGAEDSVAMIAGRGATAAGRVIFEGDTPAPPSPGRMRIPLFSEHGMCRSGEATIAADWSFRVEGLSGTCASPPMGMFGRWMLKAVIVNDTDLADSPVTFEPGQQWRNVQVIVTDRRSQLSFRVTDDNGQATREYVALIYPVEKTLWRSARPFVPPPFLPLGGRAAQATLRRPGAIGMMQGREESGWVRPGEYYVVAVDDLEPDDYRDTSVLDRLRSSATRVTVPEGSTVDVPLRRISFADVMSSR